MPLNRYKIIYIVICLALLCYFTVAAAPAQAAPLLVDRIIAKVNNEVVTLSELQEFVQHQQYLESGKVTTSIETNKMSKYLDTLIEDMLISQAAEKMNIEVATAEVDSTIEYFLSDQKLNMEQLKASLKMQGLTLEKYRQMIKKQLQKTKLINMEIKSQVSVDDQEIAQYYLQNSKTEFAEHDSLKLAHFFFTCQSLKDGEECLEKRQMADAALERLRAGENWEAVAKDIAELGPDVYGRIIGEFKTDELNQLFAGQVRDLASGEITDVFTSDFGYHILIIINRTGAGAKPLSDVKEIIWQKIFTEKFESQRDRWINRLKDKAYIEIML
jgi:peptidyl-prolyl cis-trans isomerase SurA